MEYALLGLFVALAGAVVWNSVIGLLQDRYDAYNTGVQSQWEPPDP